MSEGQYMANRSTQSHDATNNYNGNYILRNALMPIPGCILLYYYPTHKLLMLSVGISAGLALGQLVPPRLKFRELIYI
jgi:hypothetical protein